MAENQKSAKGGKPAGGAGKGKAQKAEVAAAPREWKPRPADYKPRMKSHYEKVVRDALLKKFGYDNVMQIPKIEKIVLNMGVGEATADRKKVDNAAGDLALIAGQKPLVTKSTKSIATFKVREGMALGAKVTLRGDRMYEFLDRFVTIALPRVKDFRGLNPKSFDGRGNFACGLKEHIVFPEIDYDKVDQVWGLDVIVVTSAKTDDEARELLRGFNFPSAARGPRGDRRSERPLEDYEWQRPVQSKRITAAASLRLSTPLSAHGSRRSPTISSVPQKSASLRVLSSPRCRVTALPFVFVTAAKSRAAPEATIASSRCAATSCVSWPRWVSSRHGEVELVRRAHPMAVNDPIGDMLTRIRNAQMRRRPKVSTPASNLRARVLDVLAEEGYIRGYARVEQAGSYPEFEIELKYYNGQRHQGYPPRVEARPPRYSPVRDLKSVANGLGVAILSTPKGVMSDARAKEENVGGEIICNVF